MEKCQIFLRKKFGGWLLLACSALILQSCADAYTDDETWHSSVKNTTLSSPPADSITVVPNTDGSKFTITWPVVYGAGGYRYSLYDVTNADEPVVVDSLENVDIDGCSVVVSRTEDTNYKFVIKTLANAENNNAEAPEATTKLFTSFTPTFASIPGGTDLYEWLANNPLPSDRTDELCLDLEPGGIYTMSKYVDFEGVRVTLRCTNKLNRPTLTMGETGSFRTSAAMTLKNININCTASTEPLICLSSNPLESIKGITGKGDYFNILDPIYVANCDVVGLQSNFIYDNSKKYCVGTMLVDNCKVKLTCGSNMGGQAIFYFKQGFINDLTVKNSTFWKDSQYDTKYFVQYNNSGRCDRAGYLSNSINFLHNTFYNVAKKGQWGNYGGFAGRNTSMWDMEYNIFVDCSNGQVCRRFLGGRGNQSTATFNSNNIWFDGADENVSGYDNSGTQVNGDPAFKNAAQGDFTIGNNVHIDALIGDPRWLP